jgi:spore coat protein CotH
MDDARRYRWTTPACCLLAAVAAAACSAGDGTADPGPADVPQGEAVADIPEVAGEWAVHYDPSRVLRYEIVIDPVAFQAMLADPECKTGATPCGSEYVAATFRFEGTEYADAGVRFKGNSSLSSVASKAVGDRGYGRYSFKIKLDEFVADRTIGGIGTFNLNNELLDPSLLREHLAYRAFRDAGVPASRTAFVELWVNGEPWGLYVSVQEVDKAFLRQWFGDDSGNLYKPDYGNLVYRGPSIGDYAMTLASHDGGPGVQVTGEQAYTKKTNEADADWSDVIALMETLANAPEDGFEAAIRDALDVDRMVDALAVYAVVVALDGYGGGLPQNYYLYRVPATGAFAFVPWDLNNSFGTFDCFTLTAEQVLHLNVREPYCAGTPDPTSGGKPIGPPDRPLITRVLGTPAIRASYEARIRELLAGPLEPEAMVRAMDEARDLIAPFVAADAHPFYLPDEFARSFDERVDRAPGMKPFVRDRSAIVLAMLDAPVACGDGKCAKGENCAPDCTGECPDCQVWFQPKSMCVPSCKDGCTCPAKAPDGSPLVCDAAQGICHP